MKRLIAALVVGAVVSTGCATSNDAGTASKDEIEITMRDSRFDPSKVTVKRGEPVTFRFLNRGSLEHEAFIGSAHDQKEHERAMEKMGDEMSDHGGGHMSEEDSVTVKPGKSATLEHTFTRAGDTLIGCHQPGHYAQGMVLRVTVR